MDMNKSDGLLLVSLATFGPAAPEAFALALDAPREAGKAYLDHSTKTESPREKKKTVAVPFRDHFAADSYYQIPFFVEFVQAVAVMAEKDALVDVVDKGAVSGEHGAAAASARAASELEQSVVALATSVQTVTSE